MHRLIVIPVFVAAIALGVGHSTALAAKAHASTHASCSLAVTTDGTGVTLTADGVSAGTYYLEVDGPDGSAQTAYGTARTHTVTATFAYVGPGNYSGWVYVVNADGSTSPVTSCANTL